VWLAALSTLSLVLLVLGDHVPAAGVRAVGAWVFAPFDRVVLAADRLAAAWRENGELHARVVALELETRRLRLMGVENARLRDQLDFAPVVNLRVRPVEILALSGDAVPLAATLSAGSRHGVRTGDAVVTRHGLLGRVSETYPTLSRAMLLTDPNSAVACEIESTGVLGVLRFTLEPKPRLVLMNVPLSDTVRAGQVVLTSGLSRHYPRGLEVGRVTTIGRDRGGLTQEIEVEPAVRLSRLRHAFIIPNADSLGVAR
jgi:rod shape-determining protein MreC